MTLQERIDEIKKTVEDKFDLKSLTVTVAFDGVSKKDQLAVKDTFLGVFVVNLPDETAYSLGRVGVPKSDKPQPAV